AKGFGDPVQVWQVIGASAVQSRFEALRTATTPLVGRGEEIELLLRRWELAKAGDGQVVLISGEPGIGKSRIAQSVVERLSGEPHTRLRYFCSPHHQDSALYPSIAQLERAAGFRREDTEEQRLAKLEAVLSQGTNDLSEAVPLLADLLSIATGDRYPHLNLTPQKRKERTFHAQIGAGRGTGGVSTGADGMGGRALERSHHARGPRPPHRSGAHAAGAGDPHLPARVHAALDWAPTCDDAHAQSSAPPAGRRDDPPRDRRQGAAKGDRGPDRRSDGRRCVVHRGADQDRGGERHCRRSRWPLRGGGADGTAGDPNIAACIAPGAARSPGTDPRGCPDRRSARALVLARVADHRRGNSAAADR